MTVAKEFHKRGDRTERFRIMVDETAEDPWTEFDTLSKVFHTSGRYHFPGDTVGDRAFILEEIEQIREAGAVVANLYLYEHSVTQLSTEPFACPWDSGQIGFIAILKEDVDKEFSGHISVAMDCIKAEVDNYNLYLSGEVYGFDHFKLKTCECCKHVSEESLDSCWGFYGADWESMMADAGLNPEEWEEA